MKSLLRFLFVVLIVSMAVAWLYNLNRRSSTSKHEPEKFTGAEKPALNLKDVEVLSAINRETTRLVNAVVPSVVSITTTKTVRVQRQPIDPFEFFFGRRFYAQPEMVKQQALGSGVIVSKE